MDPTPVTPLLSVRHLTAVLRGDSGELRVLDEVALSLAEGEIVDVTGPSGAGKTTLLRAVALLLPGATGELELAGAAAHTMSPQEWRSRVALLPQKPALVCGDVRTNLVLPWTLKVRHAHHAPAEEVLRAGMDGLALGAVALDRDVARLSVGQQARIALLRVLLTHPTVLLLDEPDAALDADSSGALAAALSDFASQGGAVLRVRHREADGLATRRLRLESGTLQAVGA